jgi:hypothetical protein
MGNDPRHRSSCRTGSGHHFAVKVRYENETTTKECAKIMKFSVMYLILGNANLLGQTGQLDCRGEYVSYYSPTKIVMSKVQLILARLCRRNLGRGDCRNVANYVINLAALVSIGNPLFLPAKLTIQVKIGIVD